MTLLEFGNWDWKKSQLISSATGSALTDYQVTFTVNRTIGTDTPTNVYLGTKCKEDFSDVRFYDAENDVFFSHNIEEINGTVAIFCIKIPSLPVAGKRVWIVYDDSSSIDASAPASVYEMFDKFEGSSIDTGKWTVVAGSVTVSGGNATIGADSKIQSIQTFGVGYGVRVRAYFPNAYNSLGFGFGNSGSTRAIWYRSVANGFAIMHIGSGGPGLTMVTSTGVVGAWRTYDMARYSTYQVRLITNGASYGVVDNGLHVTDSIPVEMFSSGGNSGIQIESFYVVKAATAVPTKGSWTAEEEIINFSKMDKYYARERINLGDSQVSPVLAVLHEVITLSDSAARTIHMRVLKEIIYLGDSGKGFLTHWAREIIRLGNVAAGAFIAKETIYLHNGDDPNCQGCDEYGTGIVDEDLDEYGNPVFNVLNSVGNIIRKAMHYKTDTKCKAVTDIATCKETVYLSNSAEEDV